MLRYGPMSRNKNLPPLSLWQLRCVQNSGIAFVQCLVLLQVMAWIPSSNSLIGDVARRQWSFRSEHASRLAKELEQPRPFCHRLQSSPASDTDNTSVPGQLDSKKRQILDMLRSNKLLGAYRMICDFVAAAEGTENEDDLREVSREIDQVLRTFTTKAFLAPYSGNNARRRIMLGMDTLALQLSSSLAPPYNTVPKKVFLDALRALTVMNESQQPAVNRGNTTLAFGLDSSYSAFRILQRLVTGNGIRRKGATSKTYNNGNIQEKDFNMVLNSFSNIGRMDMAHKIIALQERTENAPPLSPVAYSILLKGYGRLGDLRNVDMIVTHAKANGIVPDTIMLNGLIDAYVNCQAVDKATRLFNCVSNRPGGPSLDKDTLEWIRGDSNAIPAANRRTFNTMLKGLAKTGTLKACLSLSQEMQQLGMWDTVTTNTLVHAAMLQQNFTMAEALLNRYTVNSNERRIEQPGRHPNVEAYTELLDGYSKAGKLKNALRVMQTMKDRGVEPTDVTYTCLVAAFARQGQVEKARQMIEYMTKSEGLKPSAVTYNAFMSALLSPTDQGPNLKDSERSNFPVVDSTDEQVDEALRIFYGMMKSGIPPNDASISMIVLALGRCRPVSRVEEAKALVAKLENNGILQYSNSAKVATALVQACGYAEDMHGTVEAFKKLKRPDLMAVNTFLDACCRCGNEEGAMKTYQHFFEGTRPVSSLPIQPDVITYTILICGLLRKDTNECSMKARVLYDRMKAEDAVFPDNTMVDL